MKNAKSIYTFAFIMSLWLCFGQAAVAQAQQAAVDTLPPAAKEQLLSLDVKDTDLRDVIRMISKGYNLNIILDHDVKGNVTLHLADVPIMEGLRKIAESNGLALVQDGSVYKIQKAAEQHKSMVRFLDGKLTVDVHNVDVKEFLRELSAKTAVSIVPDVKVEGRLTGKLFNVSIDDGLRAMLEGNGFKVTKRRNIYQISPGGSGSPGAQPRQGASGGGGGSDFYVDYTNGLITLSVTNGDLDDILKAISEQGDIEIITYGSIKSEMNARINNAPITEALALLLSGTRYTFVQRGKVILIGDRNTATPSGQALSKSELIHLRHIKADNIPSILPKDIPSSNVRVIKEQNALLISGTSEDIVTAREFLRNIDIPTPQVRIDAVIVEYKENLDKEFGIKYGKREREFLGGGSYFINPAPATRVSDESANMEIGISGQTVRNFLNRSIPNKETVIKGLISEDFFMVLQFLEDQNKAKVLAQPSILTLNGNKASIDVSETQYFKVTTGTADNYTIRFQPIKFGIQLDIVPWISQSGQITAEITPVVSNSDKTNVEGYPNVSSRSLTTTVRLNNGETLILGGLIKNQESQFRYKVPLLGNIPIIGALFRHSGTTKSKSNLVVYITPTIVTREQVVDLDAELERFDKQQHNFFSNDKADAKNKKAKRPAKNDGGAEPAAAQAKKDSVPAAAVLPPKGSAAGKGTSENKAVNGND
jgi:type IV pilus assembly protein PilQ